ncbi:hypothetical protein COEREDRAFT_10105 [Coemansia reversa NRRL 1564]|uniref:Uncharacterized protein n=1 Tax=Coemansia reversa (strain ATCC 12441 / NRRL 1564) TaxID=763665 RepID=A0A2G5B6P8_COERN|nr:hypothetical protein COEREDRAFT_10105 [Coemansia reversa NRRL 1564]|eukprot:PIA14678.1 hypothetical protein COEREDRAFT_10105 [Coemansia reversa NRRL 1564]
MSADECYKLDGLGNRQNSSRGRIRIEQSRVATYYNASNVSGSQKNCGSPDMYLDKYAGMGFQGKSLQSGNGLAVGTKAYMHRASFNGSVIGSHTPSGLGSLQARKGKTSICSNWYCKEKMLSDSRFVDQEFESSGEEDFDSKESGYSGDIFAQQKLIQ